MPKGILGRKLGMTQVFDPETGAVTPVTVIQAGPCPVVQVRTKDADGYDAVQLAFDAVEDRKISNGERGHLAKFNVGSHRKLVEFRGAIDGAVEGESVTVETFEPGDKVKVAGIGIGKGFQGTIKRHNFSSGPRAHGSHNVRKPGSIGASATPSRVFTCTTGQGPAWMTVTAVTPPVSGSNTWVMPSFLPRIPFAISLPRA